MVKMLQPSSHTCGGDSLFSSRILHPKKNCGVSVCAYVVKEKFVITGHGSFTACADMMRTSTMSHASAAATGHTGQSLQVRLEGLRKLTETETPFTITRH